MPTHDYTPQEAFALLMRKLNEKSEILAAQVQGVVDTGKDTEETEPFVRGRKKLRHYRKAAPYSYQEALQIAAKALEAHFIEQPRFVNSCHENMAKAAIGEPKDDRRSSAVDLHAAGREKAILVELRTETQISESGQDTFEMRRIPTNQIEEQQANLLRLQQIFDF